LKWPGRCPKRRLARRVIRRSRACRSRRSTGVDGAEIHVALCPRRIVAATDVLLELILGLVRRVQVWSSETR
jgi:hypothetical protein